MPDPTQAVIACGTEFSFATDLAPTVFTLVPEFVAIGDIGTTGEFVDVTRLDSPDCTREYIGGMLDPSDKELRFHRVALDAGQDALIVEALARATVIARIDIPNLDTRYEFNMALSGRRIVAPVANEAVDFMINGKESGALTETSPIPPP